MSFVDWSVSNVTPVHQAATGAPDISGIAQVRRTPTGGPGTVADTNDLANPGYGYLWIRIDGSAESDISGATGSTYTLSETHAGRRLKVRVTFEDDPRYPQARPRAATAAVPEGYGPRLLSAGARGGRGADTAIYRDARHGVGAPAASGDTLTLAAAALRSETETVGSTKPSGNPLRDARGNSAGTTASQW